MGESAGPSMQELPAEDWAALPTSQWPQILLTNEAAFRGHTPLSGASAFLIQTTTGRILGATAKHLLGENGGVEPPISVERLDDVLDFWDLFPRTAPERFVACSGVGAAGLEDPAFDWLVLELRGNPSPQDLPARPLRLRAHPVAIGEEVYLVGCPYVESDCAQNVYRGVVQERSGDLFRYDIDPPADIRGFSGAPIVDRNGHLVGMMTVWFTAQREGEKYLEAGGEDAATIYPLVEAGP